MTILSTYNPRKLAQIRNRYWRSLRTNCKYYPTGIPLQLILKPVITCPQTTGSTHLSINMRVVGSQHC